MLTINTTPQESAITHEQISATVTRLRNCFDSGKTRPLAFRQQQLTGISRFLQECEQAIIEAVGLDLGKPALETLSSEILLAAVELNDTRKHLAKWMRPERVATLLSTQPGKSYLYREPRGVVLIIAPWNLPVFLAIVPLIGALAAGNCVILKPSELSPATSALLAKRLPHYLDPDCVQIIEGGVTETTQLLNEKFDHIFYTGNTAVGKIIMEAAAKQLTPVTLELGGKSPCIVDRDADLMVAARRILWGKFSNAGQICLAPDYVLAHAAIEEELLACMRQILRDFYGSDPQSSSDYGRIINDRHYQRLIKLLENGGQPSIGGNSDQAQRYIAPTILRNVPPDAPIMAEEIFGPLLPMFRVQNMQEAITFVNARPKPLALYLFSKNKDSINNILEKTSSGAVLINHVIVHFTNPILPFGGIGDSGMGAYRGKTSFDTFSHCKPVLQMATWVDQRLFYPPYSKLKQKILRWLQRIM